MKKKIVWIISSCLMVLSLVLASCGSEVPEEEEEEGPTAEEPQHGGIINFCVGYTIKSPNPMIMHNFFTNSFSHDMLGIADWARGLGGTGELTFMNTNLLYPFRGAVAESWEQPDPYTIIFHIRQGVHWHDKPPVNGRELTAQDVVDATEYLLAHPEVQTSINPAQIDSMTAPDKYTFVVKANVIDSRILQAFMVGANVWLRSAEMEEAYGEGFTDVDAVCGTGPFILKDFTASSSATYERNPDYWGYDELHPENQLPYADGVKFLMVSDSSTRLSALRTGKVDSLTGLSISDAESLKQTSPELKSTNYLVSLQVRGIMRADKEPYSDIRVRKALNMAIDRETIVNDYYKGQAEIMAFPLMPESKDVYIPLEEYPESIREYYEYNQEKARELLTDAGYPDGFQTECITTAGDAEKFQIVVAYWKEIGIDCEINVLDAPSYSNVTLSREYPQMAFGRTFATNPVTMMEYQKTGGFFNLGFHNDPDFDEKVDVLIETQDEAEQNRMIKELTKQYLDTVPIIAFPAEYQYTFWWPWIKSYHGEPMLGQHNYGGLWARVWIDQELKKEMGY